MFKGGNDSTDPFDINLSKILGAMIGLILIITTFVSGLL